MNAEKFCRRGGVLSEAHLAWWLSDLHQVVG